MILNAVCLRKPGLRVSRSNANAEKMLMVSSFL